MCGRRGLDGECHGSKKPRQAAGRNLGARGRQLQL